MTYRRKFFITFCFIILDAFLIIGFLVIRDATSINELKKEVSSLSKLSLTTDRFNTSIKTTGGYAIVEKGIKEYLDNYALEVQDVNYVLHDEKFLSVLSYDNYVNDGPDFSESITYLLNLKENFNTSIDTLLQDLDENTIMNNIYNRTKNDYYISLYHDLMFNKDIGTELNDSKEYYKEMQNNVNNNIDTSLEVLYFLNSYNGYWTLEDGNIKFETEELLNYYSNLIAKINVK